MGVTGGQADVLCGGDHITWLPSTQEGWEGALPEELGTSGDTCRDSLEDIRPDPAFSSGFDLRSLS